MDRRRFVSQLGGVALASGLTLAGQTDGAEPAAELLPTIQLGKHRVSRLVAGSNPLNGYSYLGAHTDQHMREYFTVERGIEFLQACERVGINTHQFSTSGLEKTLAMISGIRERGSSMQFICLASGATKVKSLVERARPIAMVHHGGVTDRLFHEGKSAEVHDFVKAAHDAGVLAGVSAHNPDCIKKIADAGWELDLFMTCFYYITREKYQPPDAPPPDALDLGASFGRNDPAAMTRVIQQVKTPCLAFKILAAGRKCINQETVREAFRFAYANIKPTDGVIVGMYPRFYDEISANAKYAREFGRPADKV